MARTRTTPPDGGLGTFEGRDVIQTSVKITGTGDGLSKDMILEPVVIHQGDTVYVLLELECVEVGYQAVPDTDCMRRRHTLKALLGTIVAEEFAAESIEAQRLLVERAKGVQRLGDNETDDDDGDDED